MACLMNSNADKWWYFQTVATPRLQNMHSLLELMADKIVIQGTLPSRLYHSDGFCIILRR